MASAIENLVDVLSDTDLGILERKTDLISLGQLAIKLYK